MIDNLIRLLPADQDGEVCHKSYPYMVNIHYYRSGAARRWLREQKWPYGKSSFSDDARDVIYGFDDPSQALLFKLTWAGKQ